MRAMVRRAPGLRDVTVIHLLTAEAPTMFALKWPASFGTSHFLRDPMSVRRSMKGAPTSFPIFLSEVEALFSSGAVPIDVALIHVSPPDEHGFCSYGVGVDTTKTAAEHARIVIAQVNPKMPRTLGDSFIHVNKIHRIVEVRDDILEYPLGQVSDLANELGQKVADLIEDGSTLQVGIGEVPDAVLHYLSGKKDLGIHTEMVSDGIVNLIEKGVVTNEKKTLHPGKVILGFGWAPAGFTILSITILFSSFIPANTPTIPSLSAGTTSRWRSTRRSR